MTLRLVISDVDGTIVTGDKSVAPTTVDAAARLQSAGAALSIVSARPPRGMQYVHDALHLTGLLAGFNGGLLLAPDGSTVAEHFVPEPDARTALALFAARGVQTWLYSGPDWFVRATDAPHVAHEQHTIRYAPTIIDSFEPHLARVSKMVGVSDDAPFLAAVETDLQALVADRASAHRSQTYYLDLTAQKANKGAAVRAIAAAMDVALEDVAVIGDNYNDLSMFDVAGFSVAMGNAPDPVKARAGASVARSNDDGGWAEAVDTLLLPRMGR